MSYAVNPLLRPVSAAPIPVARSWIAGRRFPADKPLIDVSQAVPGYPPPPEMTRHLAELLADDDTSRYTDVPGVPELREALAADIGAVYRGAVAPDQVAITAGCNQAFCFAIQSLAAPGDEVILPLPYYFNHQMWLEMSGVVGRHLPFHPERGGLPDVDEAAALIGPKTRAIVLVTPNNPTGAVYPPALIELFFALAKAKGIALVLDETYRDFLPDDEAPHGLFRRADWAGTLVQLYSFSKAYCITGYRVGSVAAGPQLLEQLNKVIDTVAICAPHVGQLAALYGLNNLVPWRRENTKLMRRRLAALRAACEGRNDLGYRLVTAGAYFAYLEHPFAGRDAESVARRLAMEENLLALPGSWFGAEQERYLRVAFANVGEEAMPEIARRLAADAAKG
jgi:aspartate/methionine/tyrosine aminotransferase